MSFILEVFSKSQLFARQHIGNKIYFLGPPRVGKTTLVEELKTRQEELHLPSTLEHTRARKLSFREALSRIEYIAFDAGGDYLFGHIWMNALIQDPPIGIVFVVDHEQKSSLENDLKLVLGPLQEKGPSAAITRGTLIFINKYDLWRDSHEPKEIIAPIEDLIFQFERIGIRSIVRWGSARYYKEYGKLLDKAFTDFHDLLFDPFSKISKWPRRA